MTNSKRILWMLLVLPLLVLGTSTTAHAVGEINLLLGQKEADDDIDIGSLTEFGLASSFGGDGWPEQAPFERIIVTAAAPDVPPALLGQLAPGGVMIVPVGETSDTQQLIKCRRTEAGIDYESLWPVRFVPLVGGVETGDA